MEAKNWLSIAAIVISTGTMVVSYWSTVSFGWLGKYNEVYHKIVNCKTVDETYDVEDSIRKVYGWKNRRSLRRLLKAHRSNLYTAPFIWE